MTASTEVYKTRTTAPRLRSLGYNNWAWASLADLTDVMELDATTLWFRYCSDARERALAANWSGFSWKFAEPQADGYVVKEVWDMVTGNLASIGCPPGEILVPAGWFSTANRNVEAFYRAILGIFQHANEAPPLSSHNYEDCEAMQKRGLPAVEKAVGLIDSVSEMEYALKQMISGPDRLELDRKDDKEENLIRLTFKCKQERAHMVVHVSLRQVLGKIKLQRLTVADF